MVRNMQCRILRVACQFIISTTSFTERKTKQCFTAITCFSASPRQISRFHYRYPSCCIFSAFTFGPYSHFSPLLSPSESQTDNRVMLNLIEHVFINSFINWTQLRGTAALSRLPRPWVHRHLRHRAAYHFGNASPL